MIALALAALATTASAGPAAPDRLRVEYMEEPAGVDVAVRAPSLSSHPPVPLRHGASHTRAAARPRQRASAPLPTSYDPRWAAHRTRDDAASLWPASPPRRRRALHLLAHLRSSSLCAVPAALLLGPGAYRARRAAGRLPDRRDRRQDHRLGLQEDRVQHDAERADRRQEARAGHLLHLDRQVRPQPNPHHNLITRDLASL